MESRPIRVLLIEDDEDDYILVRKLFSAISAASYDLQWASTYEAAREAIGRDRYEVCILDYQLGDKTGLDLLKEVDGKGPAVPVIFLTGHSDYGLDVEAMRAGASDYLVKGQISPDLLERSIRYAIERKRLENQLRQSHKMEALGTLAGGIAHDFNNILAAIIGFTELAADHAQDGSREKHHLTRIIEAGIRGRELVRQMLTFSRETDQEKKPLRLGDVVRETAGLIRAATPSTIAISVNTSDASGFVLADPVQMQQVLINLCTNAAHAMRDKGGTLDIELADFTVAPSDKGPPEIEPGAYMRLTVADTGAGIPPAIMERIFDPFFTTKKFGEGTGLGLSVVHGIVRQAGGHITVESKPSSGSTFTLYFPSIAGEPDADTTEDDAVPTGSERILFIDDEETIVEMCEDILAELGYRVTSMRDSTAALDLFRRDPSGFDIVMTDQTMPEMTGVELAKEILAIRKEMPVVLCTGFSHTVDAEKAKAAGIKAFAMKPLTKAEIAKTIRRVLDG